MLSKNGSGNNQHYSALLTVPNTSGFVSSPSTTNQINSVTPNINNNSNGNNSPNLQLLNPPSINRRKYSLPVIYPNRQTPTEYLEEKIQLLKENRSSSSASNILDTISLGSRGSKRLSQVGIAVSHHLSQTIGWKVLASHQQVVEQAKCLCARFIRFKLRKDLLIQKRLNLQKLKSFCNLTLDPMTNQVAVELKFLTVELERSYPNIYSSVIQNLNIQTFPSANSVQSILQLIAQELFRNDISWARIAALYTIVGALAVDCVQIGHSEYIMNIIETFTSFVDRDLASWIIQQGGWVSMMIV